MLTAAALYVAVSCNDVGPATTLYPYRSAAFTRFLADAYREHDDSDPEGFYDWFETAYRESKARYPGQESLELPALLTWKRDELALSGGDRAAKERAFAGWLHHMVKVTIPKFSLQRGFDFYETVSRGERQCLSQSVLLAGLMQSAGIDSGTVMVWSNPKGEKSNLGHVTAIARLSNGHDLLVDASDPLPTARHRGLFLESRSGDCRFLAPVYDDQSSIVAYRSANGKTSAQPPAFRSLNVDFLRSQFDYYRGERAAYGFMAMPATPKGLAKSEEYLRRAVAECPANPLATLVLGHVYRQQKKLTEAGQIYQHALALYETEGWVAPDVREFAAAYRRPIRRS